MQKILALIGACIFLFANLMQAQEPVVKVVSASGPVKIDGKLENDWNKAETISGFKRIFLADSGIASAPTVVRLLRSKEFLYVAAELMNPPGVKGNYIVSTLQRDFPFFQNDLFGIVINPTGDKSNGYAFNVNAVGALNDAEISGGDNFDDSWRDKWSASVSKLSDRLIIEIAIPFESLQFNKNVTDWRINFIRIDNRINEYSSWVFIPRNLAIGHLSYTGSLNWDETLPESRKQITWIPGITMVAEKNYTNKKTDFRFRPSVDLKYNVTSSLQLDATVNPDFSQVEVDEARANLSRFELYYPERREFFVENASLFSAFGNDDYFTSDSRPFYSRQIGLYYNRATQSYDRVPIIAGTKISGKITPSTRIGLLSVQTKQVAGFYEPGKHLPSQNYTVGVVQQQVFKRSTISGIFANRQSFGDESSKSFHLNKKDYNRVWGADYNLLSENGKWYGRFYHHTSVTGGVKRKFYEPTQSTHGSFLRYNGRKWQFFTGHTYIGKDYNPETGFAPRTNYLNFRNSAGRTFYPKKEKSKISNFSSTVTYAIDLTPQFKKTDHTFLQENVLSFKNRSSLGYVLIQDYVKLSYEFDPSISGGKPLSAGSAYTYLYHALFYRSDPTKKISYSFSGNGGRYFNGNRYSISGSVTLKTQPWGLFSVNYRYTSIQLPQPYSSNKIIVVGPRADVSFSPEWRFTSLIQYNSLSKNLGAYMRLQWRFKPLSNLFLIYQDNYNTENFGIRTRSAAIKWEWWL